jgi:cytochrome c oxidase subunit 4
MEQHVLPTKVYVAVFAALLALTALTTWIAFQDLGRLNTPVALLIAGFKAGLVVLYFMHLRYASRLVWLFAAAGLLWLSILIGGTLGDFVSRAPVTGWPG